MPQKKSPQPAAGQAQVGSSPQLLPQNADYIRALQEKIAIMESFGQLAPDQQQSVESLKRQLAAATQPAFAEELTVRPPQVARKPVK
jgi:hypothetical protein